MANEGWISIYRKIQDHELWQDKPFSRGQAWIDILLMVNYRDEETLFDGNVINIKRGSKLTSVRKLCERWGWSNSKIIKFLKLLQAEKMLTYTSDKKKTVITVVNYGLYQNENTVKRQRNATETPQKHTNNNINNINNIINAVTSDEQLNFIPEEKEDIIVMTPEESEYIKVLESIEGYPLDRKKDLDYFKTLQKRYPTLDLVQAIKQWQTYKLDKPLKAKCNARSQINTSFGKYVEWNRCLKNESIKGKTKKDNQEGPLGVLPYESPLGERNKYDW